MYIKRALIKNFRIFSADQDFIVDDINIPNNTDLGSGLNVLVGENGCGKTAILDALALPVLEYKTEAFSITDFNDLNKKVEISLYSENYFDVAGTMPKATFQAKGFKFEGGVRSRDSKTYLSSTVVSDQKFIPVNPAKPSSNSPDLRVSVNNPFKGKRFSDNDILFLDKNRLFQTRSGNFNSTRFDRLMEDFSYQYLKNVSPINELNEELDLKVRKDIVDNTFLTSAITKFEELSGVSVKLDFLDNYLPYKAAYFTQRKENHQQIPLSNLGSGLEMIFALLYSFYLAKQSEKQLIVFIDEPELHLHPRLQEKFVDILLEFSKSAQIFLTSHSPLLVKQISANEKPKIRIVGKNGDSIEELNNKVLPYSSANEINFIAFGLATEEYHNELYEELKYINGAAKDYKSFDNDFFVNLKGEAKDSPWKSNANQVSMHTFIRNKIHHQRDNGKPGYQELNTSIEKMRTFF
jgi:predicted ATP-binding protein involved in virulence